MNFYLKLSNFEHFIMKTNQIQKNIPKGWGEKQFNDCIVLPTKLKGLKKSQYKLSGKYPIFDQGQSYISGYTDNNDFLNDNSPVILFGDHTRIVKLIKSPFVLGADGTKVFWVNENIDIDFFFYSLLNTEIPNTGYNRHFKFLKEKKFLIPEDINEQKQIAKILKTVDKEMEKTDEIIGGTEKLKKGLMQKLFEKKEGWNVLKIKDSPIKLIDGDRGVNYPKVSDFTTGGYCLFLSNKNIKNDEFIFSDSQFISKEKDELLRKGRLQKEDVILTTRGTVGSVAFYDKTVSFQNIRINSGMLILRSFDGIEPIYLYQLLKSSLLKNKFKEIVSGSAQPQLPIRTLEQVFIPIPPEGEQQKIAEILSAVDEKILVNKKLKEKLTQLKKGLSQDLLSGKVRTKK